MSPTERYHAICENEAKMAKWQEAKRGLESEVKAKMTLILECNLQLKKLREERDDIDQYKLPL